MIIPSVASGNQLHIGDTLDSFYGYPLHVDIEDGNFTDNITFGLKTVKAIAEYYKGRLDAHLFVTEPNRYIDDLKKCNFWGVCFQMEAEPYPLRTINHIRDLGMKAGLGVNLVTSVESVAMFADDIDYVIVMTGEPDNRDMNLYPSALKKIRQFKNELPKHIEIWADGGVDRNNLSDCIANGANHAIFGRAAFSPLLSTAELEELNKKFDRN